MSKRLATKKRSSRPPSPRRRSGRKRGFRALKWVTLALALLFCAGALGFSFGYPNSRGPGGGHLVEFDVRDDESISELAARLEASGLIENSFLFSLYMRLRSEGRPLARGAHYLTSDLTPAELMHRLFRSGKVARSRVTIPEGLTRFDIARRLAAARVCPAQGFLNATESEPLLKELRVLGSSAEGYLFPATYDFPQDSSPPEIVRRMKSEFDKRFGVLEERYGAALLEYSATLGWGKREIVTLASMVEKEAGVDEERAVIASVFFNRLRDSHFQPKLLQCDPTAAYGCMAIGSRIPSCLEFTGKVTHALVADPENPYNTYKHEGLPPGPIANPGMKSLEAVLTPATTRYFFFVASGDGRHTFSETYEGQKDAIRKQKTP